LPSLENRYALARLDEIDPVGCPCGRARRAFAGPTGAPASVHLVDVSEDARPHYHRGRTEIYLVLEGTGHLELDGETIPVRPFTAVLIRPLCRHRARGRMRILNVVVPPFDPADEWFDDPARPEPHLTQEQ
jgi:hypothetical protein